MITTKIILIILILHYIADQLLQHPTITKHKDTHTLALLGHIGTWGISMWLLTMIFCYKLQNLEMMKWFLFVMVIHFIIEWPLGRLSSSLLHKKKYAGYNAVNLFEALLMNIVLILSFMYFMFS